MIDDKPYIIVDNHKIQPISRSQRPDAASGDGKQNNEQGFGVVDRVTISREGLEMSKQQAHGVRRQALIENRPDRLSHAVRPLLTYSPKGKR